MNGAGRAPAWTTELFNSIQTYSSVGLALFVGWMLVSRLAGMGFSQEGKNYWLLKTAPISSTQLILSKFLVAFLPVTLLSWAFFLMTTLVQKPAWGILLFALPVIGLTVAGNTGIFLSFGIIGANLNWEDPRQMQRGVSGCLGSLVSMLYLGISLGLFFLPSILATAVGIPGSIGLAVGFALGSIFCGFCAFIPLLGMKKRVERLGDI